MTHPHLEPNHCSDSLIDLHSAILPHILTRQKPILHTGTMVLLYREEEGLAFFLLDDLNFKNRWTWNLWYLDKFWESCSREDVWQIILLEIYTTILQNQLFPVHNSLKKNFWKHTCVFQTKWQIFAVDRKKLHNITLHTQDEIDTMLGALNFSNFGELGRLCLSQQLAFPWNCSFAWLSVRKGLFVKLDIWPLDSNTLAAHSYSNHTTETPALLGSKFICLDCLLE